MDVRSYLAASYLSQGEGESAIDQYKIVVNTLPEDPQGYLQLATAYNHLGRYEQAVETYDKVLNLTPNVPDIHVELGKTYYLLRDYDQASNSFRIALDLNPDCASAQYNFSVLLADQNDLERSVQYLELAFYNDSSFYSLAEVEPVFESIRNHSEFAHFLVSNKS